MAARCHEVVQFCRRQHDCFVPAADEVVGDPDDRVYDPVHRGKERL
jgi:hypothetical protein